MTSRIVDLLGVGIGPFNLSLAALAGRVPGLRTLFLERRTEFRWHPGLLIEGATVQVPFLADLVSLVDPVHPLSFLSYLAEVDRLFPFYFAERFHIDRTEYDAYCRWASGRLPTCRFGQEVREVRWSPEAGAFEVDYLASKKLETVLAGNLVFGIGTVPAVPAVLRAAVEAPERLVLHSADYLTNRDDLLAADEIVVVGSGQSGAEVFLDLLRRRPVGRERLSWFARTAALAPMEYSKLGLEHFTPDYTGFFHGLPERVRDDHVRAQWQLHKGIDAGTIAAIHDELYRRSVHCGWPDVTITPGVKVVAARPAGKGTELTLTEARNGVSTTIRTDGVVLATGYTERSVDTILGDLGQTLRRDTAGRPVIGRDYRLRFKPELAGSIFVQNAEKHTHGVGAPDLGLGAWRAAVILNEVCDRSVYRLPQRTAFTRFGLTTTTNDGHTGLAPTDHLPRGQQ